MHRGGLQESMETLVECDSLSGIIDYLDGQGVDTHSIECELYCPEPDRRIGWNNTYIITGRHKDWVKGDKKYPLAFCDEYFTMDL